jgi:Carboxypeptidase regulatory-like domain
MLLCRSVIHRRILRASVFLAVAAAAWGQATTSLRGDVKDGRGGVVPGAVVELVRPETGVRRSVMTGSEGEYQFPQMPPGTYNITTEKAGFAVLKKTDVELLVNTPATLNLTLELASVTETVTVEAAAPTINTDNAEIGIAFSQSQVRQLPLQTRNVVELLSLQPGATPTGEVLGARRDQNNITLDGVDVNDNQDAGIAGSVSDNQGSNANGSASDPGFNSVLPIPLDSVQEFRVTVGGGGAAEGRSSGGQVSLLTKSGTNQLHGSAYEFNRNTVTSANTWFNNQNGVPRQPLVRNQFGASLGGPLKKDRAFFFFNYERRLDASGVSQIRYVPTESMKAGILSVQTQAGQVLTLNPAEIQLVDPLHIGINQQMLKILQQYPAGNDPSIGADSGLDFSGFRFNAPDHRDDRAYVGKMDFILDHAARHTLSVRGTLSNSTRARDTVLNNTYYGGGTTGLAQFPGQGPSSQILDNSKGISAQYTAVLRPNLINLLRYGFTRQGIELTGVPGVSLTQDNISQLQNYTARANARQIPTTNIVDDLTWIKGKHTITTGINFRFIRNHRLTSANSYADYGYQVAPSVGQGEDIATNIVNYLRQRTGDPNLALASPTTVASAMGELLGLLDNTTITYEFLRNGSVQPQGAPQVRIFAINAYDTYVGDSYRARKDLTISYGLHYSNERPPYETQGLQVATTMPIQNWWAERFYLASIGVPGNAQPDTQLTYQLNGPANGKASWYGPDNLNFAPRLAIAYAPTDKTGLQGKIFGSNGVFRAGAAIVYDHFGSSLITQFDTFGSQGLATVLNNLTSYNFTTSPRYNGSPAAQPPAPTGGFPYTPPDIHAIAGSYTGIASDLRAPYAYVLNATFARQLPGKLTFEGGYIGRLSHQLLVQGDVFTALENFKDPVSGQTWVQSMTALRKLNDAGVSYQQVAANPGVVPVNAFVESMFPALKNFYFPGSASANYYYAIYGVNNGSYLDTLHTVDRIPGYYGTPGGTCASRTGCFTFFPRQGSGDATWMNAGEAAFHGATVTIRRAFATGFSFDFNYTWSHSIDNASAAESAAGSQGASIQNIFNEKQFRGSSDFDIRHNINANVLYELPLGKGKLFFKNAKGWVDQAIGGWQVSTIMRYHSGLPSIIQGNLTWNTNYDLNSLAIPIAPFQEHQGIDAQGNPSLFGSTAASSLFADQYPGSTGTRALVRLAGAINFDIAVAKAFKLPWEGQRLQLRAEAFNAFNNVNFIQPSLALFNPSTFGEYKNTTPPRVMQFALRYEF